MKEDGRREPVRARVFHITDEHLAGLVAYLTGRPATTAEVVAFPNTNPNERTGGAA